VRRGLIVGLVPALVLAGCTAEDQTPEPTSVEIEVGAGSPELAVSELFRLLRQEDVGDVQWLTAPDQMLIVAMAEGVSVDDALLLQTTGVDVVARNFWTGFRQSLRDALGEDTIEVRIGTVERIAAGGTQFARVPVLFPLDGAGRTFYVVDTGAGWAIDVIASFAPALVPKIPELADAVRRTPDAGALAGVLRDLDPSLEVVAQDDDLAVSVRQAVVAALEAIRR
jgi:hypothetical protein